MSLENKYSNSLVSRIWGSSKESHKVGVALWLKRENDKLNLGTKTEESRINRISNSFFNSLKKNHKSLQLYFFKKVNKLQGPVNKGLNEKYTHTHIPNAAQRKAFCVTFFLSQNII